MPGPAATVGSMHVCPMVTGYIPHIGGPVTGPGVPTVLIGGKPAAVMGDMCVCSGPPDTIAQGEATVLIGGKPAATVGCMTAHGGSVTVGEPTVLIGTGGSGATAVMPLKKIPFPKIRIVDRVGAMMRGKSLQEAEANQQTLREASEERVLRPRVTRAEFVDYESEKRTGIGKLTKKIKMKVYTVDYPDGESLTFKLKRKNIINRQGEKQDDEDVIELTGTVNDNVAIIEYEIPNYKENED